MVENDERKNGGTVKMSGVKTSGVAVEGDELTSVRTREEFGVTGGAGPDDVVTLGDEGERRAVRVVERQHPALYGADDVEVAERSADTPADQANLPEGVEKVSDVSGAQQIETAPPGMRGATGTHRKTFVTLKRDYESEGESAVHARNVNAVRQYMISQGLRPDSDVSFVGSEDLPGPPGRPGRDSVALHYEVSAVPAVVASDFDVRHAVVVQDGPTPTERAEFDAQRESRLRRGFEARVEGTPEEARPSSDADVTADNAADQRLGGSATTDVAATDTGGQPADTPKKASARRSSREE